MKPKKSKILFQLKGNKLNPPFPITHTLGKPFSGVCYYNDQRCQKLCFWSSNLTPWDFYGFLTSSLCEPPKDPKEWRPSSVKKQHNPYYILVKLMKDTRNGLLSDWSMGGGGRHLPDFIFKTKQIKSLGMYLRFKK